MQQLVSHGFNAPPGLMGADKDSSLHWGAIEMRLHHTLDKRMNQVRAISLHLLR